MSQICIYLKMPSYLRQWLIHRHGGSELMKNDFKVDLWEYQHDIVRCGSELNGLIYQFMELRGIKEDGTSSEPVKPSLFVKHIFSCKIELLSKNALKFNDFSKNIWRYQKKHLLLQQ